MHAPNNSSAKSAKLSGDMKEYILEVRRGVREAYTDSERLKDRTLEPLIDELRAAYRVLSDALKIRPTEQESAEKFSILISAAKTASEYSANLKEEHPVLATGLQLAGLMIVRSLAILFQFDRGLLSEFEELPHEDVSLWLKQRIQSVQCAARGREASAAQ